MKQVIIRIRDCRPTYTKTRTKFYYYSIAQYKSDAVGDCLCLMPGEEIWIKVGNLYSKYISYEELMENSQKDGITSDAELYNNLIEDESLKYWLNQYLPNY